MPTKSTPRSSPTPSLSVIKATALLSGEINDISKSSQYGCRMFKVTVALPIVKESDIVTSELVTTPLFGPIARFLFASLGATHPGPEIVGMDVLSVYRFIYSGHASPMTDQLSYYTMGSVFF